MSGERCSRQTPTHFCHSFLRARSGVRRALSLCYLEEGVRGTGAHPAVLANLSQRVLCPPILPNSLKAPPFQSPLRATLLKGKVLYLG